MRNLQKWLCFKDLWILMETATIQWRQLLDHMDPQMFLQVQRYDYYTYMKQLPLLSIYMPRCTTTDISTPLL